MPDRRLFLKTSTVAHLVGQIVDRQLEPIGLPGFLFALLTHVDHLQPVSPTGVATASGVPLTTLRDNVRRLVDRGLVRRVPNPADGRSYLLELTRKGGAVLAAADPALLEAYLALEQELGGGSLERFEEALDELAAALERVVAPDAPIGPSG